MIVSIPSPARRRGSIAPLAAFLMCFLIAMVAFAVDTSWMVLVQSELHNAADAASLAGAAKLTDYYVKYNTPGASKATLAAAAVTVARLAARDNAAQNAAGRV